MPCLAVWSPIEQLQTVISGSLLRDAARTCELLRDGGLDEVDGLLNRTEIFLFGVGDFDVESIFERERHFNRRQATGTADEALMMSKSSKRTRDLSKY